MFLSNRGSFRPETSGAYTLRRRGRRRPKSGSAIGACAVARLAGSGGPIGDYYGSANKLLEGEEHLVAQHVADLVGDLADAAFHRGLAAGVARGVGDDGDVEVLGELSVGGVEHQLVGAVLGNARPEVVDSQQARHAAVRGEGVRPREAPGLQVHRRVGGHVDHLAVGQAGDEQPGRDDLAGELVGDLHALAGPVELADVAGHVLARDRDVVAVAPLGVLLAERRDAVGLLAPAVRGGPVLLPQQRERHGAVARHLAVDGLEVDGRELRRPLGPAPHQLIGCRLAHAGDGVPGDPLLGGQLQDILHGRAGAPARLRDLHLAQAVGSTAQDVTVVHVFLHAIPLSLSENARSSLPCRGIVVYGRVRGAAVWKGCRRGLERVEGETWSQCLFSL